MTVFIHRGDAPMSKQQAITRGLRHFEAEKAAWEREQGIVTDDPDYKAWAAQWVTDNEINAANNLFNHGLAAYRKAIARLSQYRLADGRSEVREMVETGEFDPETGEPITQEVVTVSAVDPLPATVDDVDPDTGEAVTVPNPLIVADDAERAAAQAVVDATPADVIDFAEAQ